MEVAVGELLLRFFVSKWEALMTKDQENLIQTTRWTTKIWARTNRAQ